MKNILHNLILSVLVWINRGKIPTFKKWIELETYKEKIHEAVETGDAMFPKYILAYISTAYDVSIRWYEKADWVRLIIAFSFIASSCPKIELPLVTATHEKHDPEDWTYDGRTWHYYSHIISKAYGWTLEYISQLQVVDALAKIQEILTDDQLDREFQYSLSEIAYVYDKAAKVGKLKPLNRPAWMRKKIQPIKKFMIPASLMPVGVVMVDGVLPEELLPKEIVH